MTTFYFNPFALISFTSFLIMILLGSFLLHKYYTAQTKFVVLLFLANAIYSFFYTFEISFKTLEEITWFYRFEYFGIPFLSTYYLLFALHFSGRTNWLTRRNKLLLFTIPVITLILVFTNEYHHFFYASEKMNLEGPFPSFSFNPGIWYYIHQGYVLLCMMLSLYFLGSMLKGAPLIYRRQLWFLLLATIFPFLGYLTYQLHLIPFGIDPVSFTFTLSGIFVYVALIRFKLFDLVPIARSELFDKILDGVIVFDLNNRLVDFNHTVGLQLRISSKDLGKTMSEILGRWPEILDFIENNKKGPLEVFHSEEGISNYFNIQILELKNSRKINHGKLIVIKDVSDLINTERERNYAASKLDAVINAMPDLIFVINNNGVITDFFISDSEQLFLNKEEVLGASLYHLFTKDEADILMEKLHKCLKTNKLNTYQYEMDFPGTLKHYEARISRMDNDHVLAIIRDVTESHEMRHDLLHQSGFQNILMKLASRFIYISESETDLVINDSLRQIGEYIGVERSCIFRYDFEHDSMTNTHEWCSAGVPPLISTRQNYSISQISDWPIYHQRGEFTKVDNLRKLDKSDQIRSFLESINILSIIAIPMISQKNCLGFVAFESVKDKRKWSDSEISLLKIFTGMLANLQEKITIEQSLVEARIKAEASNKLKTAFMNNISHEIRTPLNGIIGFGEIIANEQLSLDEKNKFLKVVQESSERLIQTIDDYLDISMLVTGNLEPHMMSFNMARLIIETVEDFAGNSELKNIAISAQIPEELTKLSVYTDYDLIRKVFNHLIGNSLKFTVKGNIWIGMSVENDMVKLYVRDTGIGIGENAQKYVFDSFMQEDFSSTRMYEGSGLGLSIVKGIVSILGGEITMSSGKGEGTTFYFTIPIGTFQPA